MRRLADGWARSAAELIDGRGPRLADPFAHLAAAMPERVARRRDASGERWASAGGRGFTLDPASPLAGHEWLWVADAQGAASGARILSAAPLSEATLREALSDRIETVRRLDWNEGAGRVEARREERLGALVLTSGPDDAPDPQARAALLLDRAVDRLPDLLPPGLDARLAFAGLDDAVRDAADAWLAPLLADRSDLKLAPGRVADAALGALVWDQRRALEDTAPERFETPAGTVHPIDYSGPDAPRRGGPRPSAVRARPAAGDRRRAAAPEAHQPRRAPDPGDARSARLLARRVGRSRQGDARPLPQAPLARPSVGGGRLAQDESRLLTRGALG